MDGNDDGIFTKCLDDRAKNLVFFRRFEYIDKNTVNTLRLNAIGGVFQVRFFVNVNNFEEGLGHVALVCFVFGGDELTYLIKHIGDAQQLGKAKLRVY